MATIEIKDTTGKKVGTADLADAVFGIEPNTSRCTRSCAARWPRAARARTTRKTRGQVSGGGAKPWRQKGTGRARQGTTRAPQWTGGGVVFGPHPRSYAFKVPNKVVKLAMRSALSAKLADEALYVIDGFDFDEPRPRRPPRRCSTLGHHRARHRRRRQRRRRTRSSRFRNLAKVRVITASEANTYDLVDNTALLFTKPALEWLEGVLS